MIPGKEIFLKKLIYLSEDSPKVHRLNKMFLSFQLITLYSPIERTNLSRCHMPGTEHKREMRNCHSRRSAQPMSLSHLSHFCALAPWRSHFCINNHKFFDVLSMKRRSLLIYSLNLAWACELFCLTKCGRWCAICLPSLGLNRSSGFCSHVFAVLRQPYEET